MRHSPPKYVVIENGLLYYEGFANNPLYTTGRIHYHQVKYMPSHCHEEISISWITQGNFMESMHGELKTGTESYVVIKPSGVLHENTFFNKCSTYTLLIKDVQRHRIPLFTALEEYQWFPASGLAPLFHYVAACKNSAEFYPALNYFLEHIFLYKQRGSQVQPNWLDQTKAHVDQHFSENLQTKELAAEVGLHPVYLSRAFRKYYGSSFKDYLKKVRLHQAMGLLAQGDLSQASVAYDCGFSDQSHFIRVFRETMGFTPGQASASNMA